MESVHPATLQLCLLLIYLVCGVAVRLLRSRFSRNGVYDRWIGAHLAGALLYLVLLCSPYLTSRQLAMLACALVIAKGSLLLGSFARLLHRPTPVQGQPAASLALLASLLMLLQWLPPHAYNEHLTLGLGLSALYTGSLAWLMLQASERPFPLQVASVLCGLLCTMLVLHIVYLGAADPTVVLYGIGQPLLLLAMVCTPLLALCFMAIDKEQELAKLHQLATLDPLTGVFNRRSFEELARKACAQHARKQRALSLLVIDLDHFKRINDTYGHSRGDMALKALAELISEQIRTADIFSRFGGEEFCLLLPDTDADGAREVAGKLCQLINTIVLDPQDPQSTLSASIGVASMVPATSSDWQRLFELADSRLFRAKSAGRNQLVWAG